MLEQNSAGGDEPIGQGTSFRNNTSVGSATKCKLTDLLSKSVTPSNIRNRRLIIGVLVAVGLTVMLVLGIPSLRLTLTTVSTDDAYVNGHITFVAARVGGQIDRVLVDDNNRVHRGIFSRNWTRSRLRMQSR